MFFIILPRELFSSHVAFKVISVIVISRMNYVLETGLLYGVLSSDFFSLCIAVDVVFVIVISRMNYVVERGCWLWSNLHGVTASKQSR